MATQSKARRALSEEQLQEMLSLTRKRTPSSSS